MPPSQMHFLNKILKLTPCAVSYLYPITPVLYADMPTSGSLLLQGIQTSSKDMNTSRMSVTALTLSPLASPLLTF